MSKALLVYVNDKNSEVSKVNFTFKIIYLKKMYLIIHPCKLFRIALENEVLLKIKFLLNIKVYNSLIRNNLFKTPEE